MRGSGAVRQQPLPSFLGIQLHSRAGCLEPTRDRLWYAFRALERAENLTR
jgi:hypothetical protein